jgi:1-deoxy-D-xylulose-5-phosphate reductoisomerase
MVEWSDGATIAQLSLPDMRLPIGYALGWPDRLGVAFGGIDWTSLGTLTFEPPDLAAFPCLGLAYAAARAGGLAPAWLSAANEVAVAAFLDESLAWSRIADVIAATMDVADLPSGGAVTAEVVYDADRRARQAAGDALAKMSS